MARNQRNSDDPLQNQTFWSRRGGRDLSAEVDYDRPCPVCGYNRRGMPMKSRCPECGSLGGWNLYDDPVAWGDRQTFGAFVSTVATAVMNPRRLARHVWCPQRLDLLAARRFRRIALAIASMSLLLAAFLITMRMMGSAVALVSLPFDAVPIIVWLNTVTIEPLGRMKEWSPNTPLGRRVHVIVHYASAWLVLSPLHVLPTMFFSDPKNVLPLLAAHAALLIVQLWISAMSLGWLLYELVDMPPIQAR